MTHRPIPVVALVLLISLALPGTALAAAGGSDLPIRGTHFGYCYVTVATGQQHCLSTGTISHFGLTTMDQDLQVVPIAPGVYGWSGTWTLTAASGDQLSGTASGTATSVDGIHSTVVGQWVSADGTGRLADVSMTLDATAHGSRLSVADGIVTVAMEVTVTGGQLSY